MILKPFMLLLALICTIVVAICTSAAYDEYHKVDVLKKATLSNPDVIKAAEKQRKFSLQAGALFFVIQIIAISIGMWY